MAIINNNRALVDGPYISVDALLRLRYLGNDLTLDTRKKSLASGDGDARTNFRGRGMEFAEVRLYQPGDDIRNIDWRVTARTMDTYTKLFQEERERPVFLVIDQRSPMFFGTKQVFKSVYAAQIAGVIAWVAMQNNDRIGALLFGDHEQKDLRARRGKHAVLGLLNQLQQFNQQLSSPVAPCSISAQDILSDVRRVARPGSAVFIVSDFHDFDEDCEKPLTQLARHTDVSLFHVFDPLESHLPSAQKLSVSNGTERLTVDTAAGQLTKMFQTQFMQQQQRLHHACRNCGSRYVRANIATPVANLMHDVFLSRRGKRSPQGDAP